MAAERVSSLVGLPAVTLGLVVSGLVVGKEPHMAFMGHRLCSCRIKEKCSQALTSFGELRKNREFPVISC